MKQNTDHVLIVGGTKGLGHIVTRRFLDLGYNVTTLSRNKMNESVPGLYHSNVDLETISNADEVVTNVLHNAGPIRYLIFCQRYRGHANPWSGEMQVTLTATDLLIRAFSDHFSPSDDKAIVIVSSVYANFVGSSQPLSYHVAKAGVNQMIKYYAWQLGKNDIRINGIMPLTFMKPESKNHYLSQSHLMSMYKNFVPLKRMGNADDSANLIEFLCSNKASFINGQCIFIDGGTSVIWPEELAKSLTGC
jgi:NAD(P)-dependent dehydrogenase (short-subunit alcohol dehydrogenase family)